MSYLVAEDGTTYLLAEDGGTYLVTEDHIDEEGAIILNVASDWYGGERYPLSTVMVQAGNRVITRGIFTDPSNDDAETDPTDILECTLFNPAEGQTIYTYGVDSEIVKESTGTYSMVVDVDDSGAWYARWSCRSLEMGSNESRLYVRPINTTI